MLVGAAGGVLVGRGERAWLEALEDGCEGVSFVSNALLAELVVAAGRWRSPSSRARPQGDRQAVVTEHSELPCARRQRSLAHRYCRFGLPLRPRSDCLPKWSSCPNSNVRVTLG